MMAVWMLCVDDLHYRGRSVRVVCMRWVVRRIFQSRNCQFCKETFGNVPGSAAMLCGKLCVEWVCVYVMTAVYCVVSGSLQ